MPDKVVTRIAPSPTGFLHVGTARTALFNYLFAKKNAGRFLLRLEDTDKERSKKIYEEDIKRNLEWLGIIHDDHVLRQSERTDIYTANLKKLLDDGFAYEAEDSEKGSGKVIRFKNPNKKIKFNDLVRGKIAFDTKELSDFIIARNISEPLYQLTVVVDDFDTNVSHVIRGEDLLSSTQRQILILEALDFTRPHYAHIPLILSPDRSKLSKRKHSTSIAMYEEMGILPEALVNYLALLGWHPKDDQEIFSITELINIFSLEDVQKSGAIFDLEKLRSINRIYMQKVPSRIFLDTARKQLTEPILDQIRVDRDRFEALEAILRERSFTFSDIKQMANDGELSYFFEEPEYDSSKICWKGDTKEVAKVHLLYMLENLNKLEENCFTSTSVKDTVWNYAEDNGKGSVLWPFRFALSGRDKSPDPFVISEILGKKETLSRIQNAIKTIS